jgi:hypothetical protein
MTNRNLTGLAGVVAAVALLLATGCSTAVPTETPGVERAGATVLHFKGAEVNVVLSYRFANQNLGIDWLFLDVAVTGNTRDSVELKREKVSLVIPSGQLIPLPEQVEFAEAYRDLRSLDMRASVAADPLDYYVGRAPCALQFLVAPGSALSLQSVWVNDQRLCAGRLYFPVPGGVQAGHYELRIDLPETHVRIPFDLGSVRP